MLVMVLRLLDRVLLLARRVGVRVRVQQPAVIVRVFVDEVDAQQQVAVGEDERRAARRRPAV